ncbi:MAG: NAD(P)(+) transhydrogenase (Re/Si-specific) subunit beta, partial [Fuerstiella sp.]|nr:NAD(P)(+) transhydrogenase (Re/Si-specific) subunit beta [Fuerstiella sp.]
LAGQDSGDRLASGVCFADVLTATAASGLIGAITLSGSLVAFAKLQELKFIRDISFPGQKLLNLFLALGTIGLGAVVVCYPGNAQAAYWGMAVAAALLGVLLVISIGGADMPVVIALLNSYSGLAASATGFVLNNNLLIIAGSLVGASGLILTRIMCEAMNRSLWAVLFGSMQSGGSTQSDDEVYKNVKSTSP